MARGRRKAAVAGAGAVASAKAAARNDYVQRLMEDEDLRDNLQSAFESARKAYGRIDGKGPTKAVLDDRKTQKELKRTISALSEAADALRGTKRKRKRRRRGGLLMVLVVGAGAAVALSEDLRKRVLDLLFGAEEEFEYTSTTMPPPNVPDQPTGSVGATYPDPPTAPPAPTHPDEPTGPVGTN